MATQANTTQQAGTNTSEPLLLPLRQAAARLGLPLYTIRMLCRSGQLPYRDVRPTRRAKRSAGWYIPTKSLEAFAEGKAKTA